MKIYEIINETTTAGAVASIAKPMGMVQRRPSIFGYVESPPKPKKKKKKKKTNESLNESMTFSAGDPDEKGVFKSVIGGEIEYDFSQPPWDDPMHTGWNPETQDYEDPPKNPNYNPELELTISNHNADIIANTLGLEDAEDLHMPINEFIAIATQWLKRNVGKKSELQPSIMKKEPERATFIDIGRPEGYLNKTIYKMLMIAKKGKDAGAKYVWFA